MTVAEVVEVVEVVKVVKVVKVVGEGVVVMVVLPDLFASHQFGLRQNTRPFPVQRRRRTFTDQTLVCLLLIFVAFDFEFGLSVRLVSPCNLIICYD
jgi:hypothetical protein